MTKEGYQPIKKETIKIIPPNTGSNVQMKKDGYTWEDLEKAWWEGFDTCKAKVGEENVKLNDDLEKENAELKAQIEKMKCCFNCKHSRTEYEHCKTDKHEKWEIKEKCQ